MMNATPYSVKQNPLSKTLANAVILTAAKRLRRSDSWQDWLDSLFPRYVSAPFAKRHTELWEWLEGIKLGARSKPFCAIWPRGGAKCLEENTEILLVDGERQKIKNIEVGQNIFSFDDESGKIVQDTIINKWNSGKKNCILIKTRTGKTIILTKEHKVRTFYGWIEAGALHIGDRIASPRKINIQTNEYHSSEEIRLLAYMIAEGSLTSGNCNFTNSDKVIVEDFYHCARFLGIKVKPRCRYSHSLDNVGRQWSKKEGIFNCLSYNKRVPNWVFHLSEHQKWIFLAAMIDTDGFVEERKLGITLANRELIDDLVYLFAQVGIVCTVYQKPNKCHGAWGIIIDQEGLHLCQEKMPLILKKRKLEKLCDKKRYSLIDTYPCDICRNLRPGLNRELRNANITRLGCSYDVTREKVRRVLQYEKVNQLDWLENAEVFWDKVILIK